MTQYVAHFEIKNLGGYGQIPLIKDVMKSEYVKAYNKYCELSNAGVTDELNKEFERLNPNYFKDNADKEHYELVEYNKFMADGYMRKIVNNFNIMRMSPVLDFGIDPVECDFRGYLRVDHNVEIEMYLKAEEA